MTEIREIFKTIQKYFGLFMNNDANSGCSSHSVCKRKYPVTNTKELSCNKSSYLEITNQLDCFGSKEPHNDDTNSVILSGAKDPLKADTNNAILRGLNSYSPLNDRKNICCLSRGDVGKSKCKVASTFAEGAMHVVHWKNSRKIAFTLAEVLITLGIIGVVAALTLPTLIQNHQKQVYVTQLKKAYSTISNAFSKMAADEGVVDWNQMFCSSTWVQDDENASLARVNECFDRIVKQIKVTKINRNQYGNFKFEYCTINNCMYDVGYYFSTIDGATYLFPCLGPWADPPEIVIDVNGEEKGPNKPGRDVFSFYVDFNHNKLIPGGAYDGHGNSSDGYKNCSATNLSTNCTAKVLIEGKMNY